MRRILASALVLAALSSGAFGATTAYWTGNALDNSFMNAANWSTGVVPSTTADCAIFDPSVFSFNTSWVAKCTSSWPSLGTVVFNVPGGYQMAKTSHINTVNTVIVNQPATFSIGSVGGSQATSFTAIVVPGGLFDDFGGGFATYAGGGSPGSHWVTMRGGGTANLGGNNVYCSMTLVDCGTLIMNDQSSGSIYNMTTFSTSGTLKISGVGGGWGPQWYLYAYANDCASYGRYNMATPATFNCPGTRLLIQLDNATKPSGINPTLSGLNARFWECGTLGTSNNVVIWCGNFQTQSTGTGGGGRDWASYNCHILGDPLIQMTDCITSCIYAHGTARTLTARITEFAPDCGPGVAGIMTFRGNLRLCDNLDLNHTPNKFTIGVFGTGGVVGKDFSQFRINSDCESLGGFLTGLENSTLSLSVANGLDCAALAAESIVIMTSNATNFSTLGARFANDAGGANGWKDGGWQGTVTYNSNNITLNGLMLAPVPEPATLLLGGTGALGLFAWVRRKRMR